MRSNFTFTIMWTQTFIMFFAYFFVTSSIVGFEGGFDETIKEKGYPNDFNKASKWTVKEYAIWAVSWLDQNRLEYFKKHILHYTDPSDEPIEENAEKKEDTPGDPKKEN